MRSSIFLAALLTIVAAAPHPQNEVPTPTLSVVPSTSLNVPITSALIPTLLPTGLYPANSSTSSTSKRRGGHSEPIPIFSRFCDCPLLATVAYPCYATDALAVSKHLSFSYTEVERLMEAVEREIKDL